MDIQNLCLENSKIESKSTPLGTTMNKKLPAQKALTIWLFGLSGAGKSTIAVALEAMLTENQLFCVRLDGDGLRDGVNKGLGFTHADRAENVRRTSEIARLLCNNNVIVICSLITPLNEHREIARSILKEDLLEVFVDCPLEVCEQRDVKGLYRKARNHQINKFSGVSSEFERPNHEVMTIATSAMSAAQCATLVYEKIIGRIVTG
ncbi:adenylyl-sulfate kinase [Pedobacter sp. BAL39]|uniref:adenylyl-sulfate kinase n=1 Tax=Pedobacter sp. BAL39 TaxID=391596 RepID=UPI0002E5D76A|nr:adenylyl-sulfate kinase [Pedobacter sp. BAL39]